jgi:hypothetical protein
MGVVAGRDTYWGLFILVLLWVMLCLNVLVRRQWTQHERLSYPIILLPLEMTDNPARFFRQPLLWAGFAISGGICILNGLHVLYPYLPYIPVKMRDISPLFASPPWNAIGWTPISFYPFAIGLGFLMPADLLFSSWFFYFFFKAQRILSAYFGWSYDRPNFPYINEQCFGGYMGVAMLAIWATRKHLAHFLRSAWRGDPKEWADEPFSPRVAVVGVVLGFSVLVAFFWVSGLTLWVSVVSFVIYFAIAIACTRMRAELGPPAHDLHNGGPDYILTAALGTRSFSDRDLTILTYFYGFNRAYRSLAMPVQLEAFKMAERKAIPARSIAFALVVASVGGLVSGYWARFSQYWCNYVKIKDEYAAECDCCPTHRRGGAPVDAGGSGQPQAGCRAVAIRHVTGVACLPVCASRGGGARARSATVADPIATSVPS